MPCDWLFNPFTFNVIINITGYMSASYFLFFMWLMSSCCLFLPLLFPFAVKCIFSNVALGSSVIYLFITLFPSRLF